MPKKLYVGNLPWAIKSSEELKEIFAAAGEVAEASVLLERETGRSRGFGFVTMATDEATDAAIQMFHGKEVKGRTLTVNEAREREERAPRPRRSYDNDSMSF